MQTLGHTIWSNYFEVASTALKSGQLQTAQTMFGAALEEAEKYDLCPMQQAASLHGLACAYLKGGDKGSSELLLRKAFRIICQADYVNANDLSNIACLLADSYLEEGEAAKAMPVLKVAAGQISRRAGEDAPALIPLLKRIALIYLRGNRQSKADVYFSLALKIEQAARDKSKIVAVQFLGRG
jgi:tetratricopeptide (TPR) repeat protein